MSRYKNEPDFTFAARMLAALAFVPPADLDNSLAELAVSLPDELMPVLTYFENTHIGSVLRLLPDGRIVSENPLLPVKCPSIYRSALSALATKVVPIIRLRRLMDDFKLNTVGSSDAQTQARGVDFGGPRCRFGYSEDWLIFYCVNWVTG